MPRHVGQGETPRFKSSVPTRMDPRTHEQIRQLFDDYLRMYSTRDDRLTAHFSDDFSGFTGGGDFLVKDRAEWVAITRQDFAQVQNPIRIELKDVAIQSLVDTIAVATGFFTIHLPIKDHILSRETARLVLIFRQESTGWKICHSSISIPYHLVREGEVYPLQELTDRTQFLEDLVAERTTQLSGVNTSLRRSNDELAREIAERKQTENALQRSEERYRSIVNASPDDITITDQHGVILLVSPMAFTIFGAKRNADFRGRPLTDFIVPEDRERALAQIALKRQGVVTGPTEYRGLRCDGRTFDIEVNSEFIRDPTGSPTGMVVIVRDITERKRAEAEREKLEAQNRQLQKSESLGRMAGAIAHHFNNQLQAVMMSLELAMGDLPRDTAPAALLTEAMLAARKAADVSTRMLTYLGQSPDKHEPLDLADVCRRCLPLLRAAMPQRVDLVTDLPAPGPGVRANANQIQQILANVVTNAWEASGTGRGTVRLSVTTVAATDIPGSKRFPIDWQPQPSAYACVEIADTGCGISPDDVEKLFDPFFTRKFAGRGLGLPVVLGIARAHDGVVTVESEPGRGSVFRIFFPVSSEAVAPVPPGPDRTTPTSGTAPSEGNTTRPTVLVVDDESAVRHGVARALRQYGLTVLTAEDGVDALAVFRQHRDHIGCVLCDLTMPRMNGWETLTALRRLAPGITVILASGYSEAQVMEGDHPERPQAFLHKPYPLAEVIAAITVALPDRTGAVSGSRAPISGGA